MKTLLIYLIIVILSVQQVYGGDFLNRLFTNSNKNKTYNRTVFIGMVLVDIPKYRDLKPEELIYNQILSYSKTKPFGDDHGRSTNAHETVHSINNQLRNQYKTELKKDVNGFYAGGGRGIIIENPKLVMRDIIPYIPNVVRGYRYKVYFIDQLGDWNDVPTYPMDEWTAYIAGAECAVDDLSNGIKLPKSDYVSGALEFSIYCTALAMAVKERQPEYWNTKQQLKHSIQYFLIKAEKVFFEGQEDFPFSQQQTLLDNLRNHQDTKDMRQFLMSEFQGVFVD